MPLLNYTTKIDVEKTIGEIQKMLSLRGASQILTDYEEGYVKALSFRLTLGEQTISFKLPCDWNPVLQLLKDDPKVPVKLCVREQAVRVAWRIVKDWVEAQMALVETNMAQMGEVFLPYAVMKGGQTLFEQMQENPSNLLGSGNE